QRDFNVDHRVSSEYARWQTFLNSFVDCRHVFTRNHTPFNFVHKLVTTALGKRLKLEHNVTILTTSTGLTDEFSFHFVANFAYGFAISNLGLANISSDIELTTQAIDQDFKVQLTHSGDNRLTGLFIAANLERWILLCQAL